MTSTISDEQVQIVASAVADECPRNIVSLRVIRAALEAYERTRASDPRVVELVKSIDAIVSNECRELFHLLGKGIGTETPAGARWLRLRAALAAMEGKQDGATP